MMNIEITQEFKSSLIPFSRELLEPLNLPKETFDFLSDIGLPLPEFELNANVTVTFLSQPIIKHYPLLQHTYLQIASLDVMGEVAVDLHYQSVHQILVTNDCGYDNAIPSLVNYSISQFVDCLGLWRSFYPQFRKEIAAQMGIDPTFSLFEHEEMYDSIMKKLREIDPKSMRQYKFFWRRMCEPDIV